MCILEQHKVTYLYYLLLHCIHEMNSKLVNCDRFKADYSTYIGWAFVLIIFDDYNKLWPIL